jgi:hypothetical protein
LGDVIDYPEQPVRSYLGFPGAGVYVGPNLDFVFDEKQRQELWSCYDWESCETNTEAIIGRTLSDEERKKLLER